jgi:hypothetical protein
MPEYLQQELMNPRGYVVRPGNPKPTEVAVALTEDGRCVFGDPRTVRSTYAKAGSKFMYYDDEVERQRRLLCDTALGQLMLDHPRFAQPAVNIVSRGIERYWQGLKMRLSDSNPSHVETYENIVKKDGKYVSSPTSFGRLPQAQPSSSEVNQFRAVIDIWVSTLASPDLPRIMNLHDTFLKIYCGQTQGFGTPMQVAAKHGLREDWYDKEARGRANRVGFAKSDMPGLVTQDFTIPFGPALDRCGIDFLTMRTETRNRGMDMFMIEATKMRPEFRTVLGSNNLVFAASASGTTSTLLASAHVFQPGLLASSESVKQYLMGCIAYLVGGGMHTCHEVFYTGGLCGLNYTPGKYLSMLPSTFTGSRLYERWASEFWEIVRPDRGSPR